MTATDYENAARGSQSERWRERPPTDGVVLAERCGTTVTLGADVPEGSSGSVGSEHTCKENAQIEQAAVNGFALTRTIKLGRRGVGCGKLVKPPGRTRAPRHRGDRDAGHERQLAPSRR